MEQIQGEGCGDRKEPQAVPEILDWLMVRGR